LVTNAFIYSFHLTEYETRLGYGDLKSTQIYFDVAKTATVELKKGQIVYLVLASGKIDAKSRFTGWLIEEDSAI